MRREAATGLSGRAKLTLFHGSGLPADQVLSMTDESISFDILIKHGIKALNIGTAGLKPMELHRMGATDASHLRRLGFDALHLVDPVFCTEANAAYGAKALLEVFLVSPQDAVSIAGSEAMATLGVTAEKLLETCAGAPQEAAAVLQQCIGPACLDGVSANTLLSTGLRAPQLKTLGFSMQHVSKCGSRGEISKLGFTL